MAKSKNMSKLWKGQGTRRSRIIYNLKSILSKWYFVWVKRYVIEKWNYSSKNIQDNPWISSHDWFEFSMMLWHTKIKLDHLDWCKLLVYWKLVFYERCLEKRKYSFESILTDWILSDKVLLNWEKGLGFYACNQIIFIISIEIGLLFWYYNGY